MCQPYFQMLPPGLRILGNNLTKDGFFIRKMDKVSQLEIRFLDRNSILRRIISQNCERYPTKNKKVFPKLDTIFIFEKIKKLSVAQDHCASTLFSNATSGPEEEK